MNERAVGERLSATKLEPPSAPSGVFVRARLVDRVDAGVRGPLTLITGPPGSGKTVLASSWARTTDLPVAWVSLDARDATPRRFWSAVARSLRRVGVDLDDAPDADDVDAGALGDRFVDELVTACLARDEPVVLVLDDVHEVAHAVVASVDRLLELAPLQLRLVLVSRHDPPLRLARLRVADKLTEIRAADLACTFDEAAAVLEAAGAQVGPAATERLWERTEGWMAALVLAALAVRSSESPDEMVGEIDGRDAALSDYLMSEMLARQPSDVQTFLLQTSIVDVLEGGLVDAVTGSTGGHARLTALARAGVLVTPVDRRGRWFRYHGLFRDLLRAELGWRRPDEVAELHARAARWYVDSGDERRAVEHAVAASDWDLAGDLAAGRWIELLLAGELDVLAPLLPVVPEDRMRHHVDLALALTAVSFETEGLEIAARRLDLARATFDGTTAAAPSTAIGLAVLELLHSRYTGDLDLAVAAARRLLGTDDGGALSVDPALRSLVLIYLGTAESWTGEVVTARVHLREALSAAQQARSPWLRLQALGYLSGAESKCGDVPAALRRAEQALDLAATHGWERSPAAGIAATVAALIATLQCRFDDAARLVEVAERARFHAHDRPIRRADIALPKLVVLAAEGRHADALDVVRAGLDEVGGWPGDTTVRSTLEAWEARLLLAVGDRAAAERILDAATGPAALLVLSTRARLLVDDGEYERARALVGPALSSERPVFSSIVLDLWLVDALACEGLRDISGAARSLERALDLAAPGELLRPFVSHGDVLLPLLRRHWREETAHRALVDRAIRLMEGGDDGTRRLAPHEPLSDRERQVLGYLPTIMSNVEIADELFVSVNTVKTHVRSIYRKLGVDNRRAAVARARELGLFATR
jgi:LuxR family maltose regulon positive regulatory protein